MLGNEPFVVLPLSENPLLPVIKQLLIVSGILNGELFLALHLFLFVLNKFL